MAKRNGSVHVATTKRARNGKVYVTHLLRRSYREGGKVKHQTLGNLSHLPPDLIETIRRRLRGDEGPAGGDFEIVRSLPHGHVTAVLGTLQNIGLDTIIGSRPCAERTLVLAMIVARIVAPRSKLATSRALVEETASCSLVWELGLDQWETPPDQRDLYAAMDWLLARQRRIENKLAKKHLHDGTLVLYDVSSSFYTGRHCSLAKFGHSRDGKKGFPQIVYGLLCNAEGCPVAVEVFEGNTADPNTLQSQINKIRTRFGIARVVLVGDRGMITKRRINESLRDVDGLDWITALRADSIKKLVSEGVFEASLFDQRDLAEVTSPDYPGERLVICRNPLLAEERTRKREVLLAATENKLDEIVAATRRERRPLRGKERIALRVGKIINRYKVAKHFVLEFSDERFSYQRDEQKIAEEAALDGLYVIRTSVSTETLDADSTVRAYKDLAKVERAFRCMKTVDLKVRPIHHWLSDRVRAHVFLCMLAYYVEWHMRARLAPILFDDHEKEKAEAQRESVVRPAPRSQEAMAKERTKRTEDNLPVHSFQTLLSDLATLAKNLVRIRSQDCAFHQLTSATTLQQHAFNLLNVTP
jgi:transposase